MQQFTYRCSICKKIHKGSPSFSAFYPDYYAELSKENKKISLLNPDFCATPDQYFFIRAVLMVPIIGLQEPFTWGVWVSQSVENFRYYYKNFKKDLSGRETFGWFSNRLPYYKDTLNLKCIVQFMSKGIRPKLHLEETGHELSIDFHKGISNEKAIEIAEYCIHKK